MFMQPETFIHLHHQRNAELRRAAGLYLTARKVTRGSTVRKSSASS